MNPTPNFQTVVEHLLTGRFVCEFSTPEMFQFLDDPGRLKHVNLFLGQIGREAARTPGGAGFYCAYTDPTDGDRSAIKSAYEEIVRNIRPLVAFLDMVATVRGAEEFRMAGTEISALELAHRCGENDSFMDELKTVCSAFRVKTQEARGEDAAFKLVTDLFGRLVDAGYMHKPLASRAVYVLTAKIEMLSPVVDFIVAENGLDLDAEPGEDAEEAPAGEQGALL